MCEKCGKNRAKFNCQFCGLSICLECYKAFEAAGKCDCADREDDGTPVNNCKPGMYFTLDGTGIGVDCFTCPEVVNCKGAVSEVEAGAVIKLVGCCD